MISHPTITIDRREIPIEGERNILEVARKAGIDIPTFCYHSELSIYGACRLCLVDVDGRGIMASCSVAPEPGMVVRTHTEEIRKMRRISLELLLANHDQQCTACPKSASCELQRLAHRLGVEEVRFKRTHQPMPVDRSSPSLVRDPNKCILCGDCVRACSEVQSVGAIDFAYRGAMASVAPAFNNPLSDVECVNCGLCAAVCPTGTLTPTLETNEVWRALEDPAVTVVAQIAPAVRVALGEEFGGKPGSIEIGRIAAALKGLGFDKVYDTCFSADLTVLEEANEFLERFTRGEHLPQFTSCCPGWVKFAEQFFPDLLPNLSSCKSPQQMFGAVARRMLPEQLDVEPQNLVVVSIMPCTAKKYEAKLDKFSTNGSIARQLAGRASRRPSGSENPNQEAVSRPPLTDAGRPDVDHVLTTQELAHMIKEAGLRFEQLEPQSLDIPMGFKTGAGVIFGATGGVTEAVLRCAVEKAQGAKLDRVEFEEVRGQKGRREATIPVNNTELKLAIVHGLANARQLAEEVRAGQCDYHLIEVMACPGGCVGGAGQPVTTDVEVRKQRAEGLYQADRMLQLRKSQDNHLVAECYEKELGEIGGHTAHQLLHTEYQSRRRICGQTLVFQEASRPAKLGVSVCVGTSCFVRGSQALLEQLMERIQSQGLQEQVDVEATFCFEKCDRGPSVRVGETVLTHCDLETAWATIEQELANVPTG